jgi:hypothetical protein
LLFQNGVANEVDETLATDHVLHCSDRTVSCWGKVPVTIALGEKIVRRISATTEEFVGTEEEIVARCPSRVSGCGDEKNDAYFDGCADMTKVRAESVMVPVGFDKTSCR